MLKRVISYLMFACLLSACASDPRFRALEDAEKAHNQKQRETSLVLMDLDEIFPILKFEHWRKRQEKAISKKSVS